MNGDQTNGKADKIQILREAFSYIREYEGSTFVIKIDSSLVNDPFFPRLIGDLALLKQVGVRLVLVPGANTSIDRTLADYRLERVTVKGIKVASRETMPIINMVASDIAGQIMRELARRNLHAVIGNWVRAKGIGVRDGVDFEHTGVVEKIDFTLTQQILQQDLIPVFPSIGWNQDGKPYSLSPNELAFHLACGLKAAKLFFITDFGPLTHVDFPQAPSHLLDESGRIARLTPAEVKTLLSKPFSHHTKGELLELALLACQNDTQRVHILEGATDGVLLQEVFSNEGCGTMVYADQFTNLRPMEHADIPAVLQLMAPYVQQDIILARSADDLAQQLGDFVLYEVDGTIHGCAAPHLFGDQAEIAAVAVDKHYSNARIGNRLIRFLLARAAALKIERVFLMTTRTSDWFESFGFKPGKLEDLPDAKRDKVNPDRRSKVYYLDTKKLHFGT